MKKGDTVFGSVCLSNCLFICEEVKACRELVGMGVGAVFVARNIETEIELF